VLWKVSWCLIFEANIVTFSIPSYDHSAIVAKIVTLSFIARFWCSNFDIFIKLLWGFLIMVPLLIIIISLALQIKQIYLDRLHEWIFSSLNCMIFFQLTQSFSLGTVSVSIAGIIYSSYFLKSLITFCRLIQIWKSLFLNPRFTMIAQIGILPLCWMLL